MENPKVQCKVDLVVKLGGSAITDKSRLETIDAENLKKACSLIRQCLDNRLTCIVVHGAGSFGHWQAKEHQVQNGWFGFTDDEKRVSQVKMGFCATRRSVTLLNHKVVDDLLQHNVQAVGISACGTWRTDNGKVVQSYLSSVSDLIHDGFVPVLHGDCVLDSVTGCAILSGDTIIKEISEHFFVMRVVFLTSVDGVYDRPPDLPGAQLLSTVRISTNSDEVTPDNHFPPGNKVSTEGGKDITDETGGMTIKLKTAVHIVKNTKGNTRVFICKIGTSYAREACLTGKTQTLSTTSGTEIVM